MKNSEEIEKTNKILEILENFISIKVNDKVVYGKKSKQ